MRFLKSIKTELFLARRLLETGYGPNYWYPYIKNRFFWRYLLSKIPKYEYAADPDLELHTVFQKKDIWMLIWSFRSFLTLSGLRPTFVIHDDGSLDEDAEKLLKSKFANVKVLFRQKTADLIDKLPNVPDIVKEARRNSHFFLNRPINILALSKAKKLILADTDILYFRPPTEVIDFVNGKTGYDAVAGRVPDINRPSFDIMMDEYYTNKHKLEESPARFVDGGYLVLNRDKLNFDQMVEFLEHTKRPITHYFIEMAYCGCMLSQLNFAFLPTNRYHIKGAINDQTVFKHFSSPRRYEMFAYGFDAVRKVLETENLK